MKTHRLQVRWGIVGESSGTLAAAVLALAAGACTRNMSLGYAGTPDGGDTIVITSNDAGDVPADLGDDGTPDVAADAPDAHSDRGPGPVDAPAPVVCIDNGVA